jgi:hypothetical protein
MLCSPSGTLLTPVLQAGVKDVTNVPLTPHDEDEDSAERDIGSPLPLTKPALTASISHESREDRPDPRPPEVETKESLLHRIFRRKLGKGETGEEIMREQIPPLRGREEDRERSLSAEPRNGLRVDEVEEMDDSPLRPQVEDRIQIDSYHSDGEEEQVRGAEEVS